MDYSVTFALHQSSINSRDDIESFQFGMRRPCKIICLTTLVDTLGIIIFDRRRILKMKRRLLLSEVLIAVSIMSAGLSVSPSMASVILQSHHVTGQNQLIPSLSTKVSEFALFIKSDFSNRIASCSLFQIPSEDKFKLEGVFL